VFTPFCKYHWGDRTKEDEVGEEGMQQARGRLEITNFSQKLERPTALGRPGCRLQDVIRIDVTRNRMSL
jgi:hypothetical protein